MKVNTNPNLWRKQEIRDLKRLFPNLPTEEVAARLGKSIEATRKYASRHGIKKSRKYRREVLHLSK